MEVTAHIAGWKAHDRSSRYAGLAVVVALHAVAIAALLQYEPARSALSEAMPIMVSLITPPRVVEKPQVLPKPLPVKPRVATPAPPVPQQIITAAPTAPEPALAPAPRAAGASRCGTAASTGAGHRVARGAAQLQCELSRKSGARLPAAGAPRRRARQGNAPRPGQRQGHRRYRRVAVEQRLEPSR